MSAENIIIISANDLVRHGIYAIVKAHLPSISSIQSLKHLEDVMTLSTRNLTQILFIDDEISKHCDIESYLKRFKQNTFDLKIIILSHYLSVSYIKRLLDKEVDGFIYKNDALEEVLPLAIKTVMSDCIFLSPSASILPYEDKQFQTLNQTDIDVLQLLAKGYTVQEISSTVHIVDRSVYRIRSKLRCYLGVRTNEQIVDAARVRDLILSSE